MSEGGIVLVSDRPISPPSTWRVRRGLAALRDDDEKEAILRRVRESSYRPPSLLSRCWRGLEERAPANIFRCLDSPYLPPAAVASRKTAVITLFLGSLIALASFGESLAQMLPSPAATPLQLLGYVLPDTLLWRGQSGYSQTSLGYDQPRLRTSYGIGGVLDIVGALMVLLCGGRIHNAPGDGSLSQAACLLLLTLAAVLHTMVVFDIVASLGDLGFERGQPWDLADALAVVVTIALVLMEAVQIYFCDRARVALLSPPAGGQGGPSLV